VSGSTLKPDEVVTLADHLREVLVVYGGQLYQRHADGVCSPLGSELDQNRALSLLLGRLNYHVEESALRRVYRTFMARTAPKGDLITPVRFDDDDGDCLARISLPESGDCFAWEEFTSRLGAPNSFKAWVWSIFESEHAGRQMLWLRGDGHDGKSRLIRVLAEALGAAAGILDDERLSGDGKRFALASVWDKRLIAVPDTKIRTLAMTGMLHHLSGGDRVAVEPKGLPIFSAQPNVRVIIGSNERPQINQSRSNTSRLLPIEVGRRVEYKSDAHWPGRLREELPAFLADCRRVYQELCPDQGDVPLDGAAQEALDTAAETGDDYHAHVAEALGLVPDPDGYVTMADLMEAASAHFPALASNSNRWGDFKRWLYLPPMNARPGKFGVKRNVKVLRGIRFGTRTRAVPDHWAAPSPDSQERESHPELALGETVETPETGVSRSPRRVPASSSLSPLVVSVVSEKNGSRQDDSGNGANGGGLAGGLKTGDGGPLCLACRSRAALADLAWCEGCYGALLGPRRCSTWMSGEVLSSSAPLLPVGRVAAALGIGTRQVYRLVAAGRLPPPEHVAGRNLWRGDDVKRLRLDRLEYRPRNRRHARRGNPVARRVKQERVVVARVLLELLDGEAGRQIAFDLFRRYAPRGLRGLGLDGLERLVAELEGAIRLARAL